MSAFRRMVVAFVEVESVQARMWRQMAGGDTEVERTPRVEARSEGGGWGEPRLHYWCAADKPPTDDSFNVAPVYRTGAVPEDAGCETCGISIRELQRLMGEVFDTPASSLTPQTTKEHPPR